MKMQYFYLLLEMKNILVDSLQQVEIFFILMNGSAEHCSFSPYSDINLKEYTLREALESPLFRKFNETGMFLGWLYF